MRSKREIFPNSRFRCSSKVLSFESSIWRSSQPLFDKVWGHVIRVDVFLGVSAGIFLGFLLRTSPNFHFCLCSDWIVSFLLRPSFWVQSSSPPLQSLNVSFIYSSFHSFFKMPWAPPTSQALGIWLRPLVQEDEDGGIEWRVPRELPIHVKQAIVMETWAFLPTEALCKTDVPTRLTDRWMCVHSGSVGASPFRACPAIPPWVSNSRGQKYSCRSTVPLPAPPRADLQGWRCALWP